MWGPNDRWANGRAANPSTSIALMLESLYFLKCKRTLYIYTYYATLWHSRNRVQMTAVECGLERYESIFVRPQMHRQNNQHMRSFVPRNSVYISIIYLFRIRITCCVWRRDVANVDPFSLSALPQAATSHETYGAASVCAIVEANFVACESSCLYSRNNTIKRRCQLVCMWLLWAWCPNEQNLALQGLRGILSISILSYHDTSLLPRLIYIYV